MNRFCISLVFLLFCPRLGMAQTRDETVNFIIDEFKSFERKDYQYTELGFSANGDTFTMRRNTPRHKGRALSFQLKEVEIYTATVPRPDKMTLFTLMVRNRGRDGYLQKNSLRFAGTVKLLPSTGDERQYRALERAFARLTALSTGRKFLFYESITNK